uniref:Uncharacterized protein n=1 Tax=Caenorhabditis tropicalis TaxID=1561998 RepID=A0A1I7U0C1_9PELO
MTIPVFILARIQEDQGDKTEKKRTVEKRKVVPKRSDAFALQKQEFAPGVTHDILTPGWDFKPFPRNFEDKRVFSSFRYPMLFDCITIDMSDGSFTTSTLLNWDNESDNFLHSFISAFQAKEYVFEFSIWQEPVSAPHIMTELISRRIPAPVFVYLNYSFGLSNLIDTIPILPLPRNYYIFERNRIEKFELNYIFPMRWRERKFEIGYEILNNGNKMIFEIGIYEETLYQFFWNAPEYERDFWGYVFDKLFSLSMN